MSGNTMSFGIAMVSSVFYPSIGGAQTVVLQVSRQLLARGVPVIVVTRRYRDLAPYETIDGVPTYRVGLGDRGKATAALTYITGALRLLYELRDRYDIVHCHEMISPMTIGLLAKLLLRKPLVINPHRSGPIGDVATLTRRRPVTGGVRLLAARRLGDAFVCISPAIRNELLSVGVDESRLWDIANGVDTQRFRPAGATDRVHLRRTLGLPAGPVAVYTGRLVPEKGLTDLLDAWQCVVDRVPDARLLILGEGPQRDELEERARRLGLDGRVCFAGGVDDVASYLRAADLFVLPSYAEGLPVALLEAMACGLPCVATAIDGTRDLLTDGETGRLVPAGDPDALAAGLVAGFTSPDAKQWGQSARDYIETHYSLASVTDRYVHMYESLLDTSGYGWVH